MPPTDSEPRPAGLFTAHFGRRNTVVLSAICEACGNEAPLSAYDTREWFRLGPLPLFPRHAWRVHDACPLCGHHRRLPLADYRRWALEQLAPDLAAVRAAPEDPELRVAAAWRCCGLGCFEHAAALLTPALLRGDAPAALHHVAGVVLKARRRWGDAVTELRAAAELAPSDGLYRLDLGRALRSNRTQLSLAIHHLEHAVDLRPDDPVAWAELAAAYDTAGRFAEAREAERKVAGLEPGRRQDESDEAPDLG